MAAGMTPLDLVDLLNEVFHCFDSLVDRYGVEKIKTIGDCYMVAASVPGERADHAIALVGLALDMQAAIGTRTFGAFDCEPQGMIDVKGTGRTEIRHVAGRRAGQLTAQRR
jgi:class 3 adenylate cyclase